LRFWLFLFISLLFFSSVFAVSEGRIEDNKVPSLLISTSLERSSVLYVAPVAKYLAINFGLTSYQSLLNGMSFGSKLQWLDAAEAGGTIGLQLHTLGTRKFDQFLIGGTVNADFNIGTEKRGWVLGCEYSDYLFPKNENIHTFQGFIGSYFSPVKYAVFSIQPGFGRNFGLVENWFINITLTMEAYFWK